MIETPADTPYILCDQIKHGLKANALENKLTIEKENTEIEMTLISAGSE